VWSFGILFLLETSGCLLGWVVVDACVDGSSPLVTRAPSGVSLWLCLPPHESGNYTHCPHIFQEDKF
jgi:hypothetical protein